MEIALDDSAEINNTTSRERTANEDAQLPALLGYEASLNRFLPQAIDPTDLVEADSTSDFEGTGTIEREEEINVKVAAVITQVLPNGNLVIHGRQETRINFEARELQIAGVIRPEDITSGNTIAYEKVAEARLAYGGRGQITDFQQPPLRAADLRHHLSVLGQVGRPAARSVQAGAGHQVGGRSSHLS